ncbi:MAG: hypothetical protein LBR53_09350 [Deltaproteobacteria bacterium]|jgi:hypothetical protein|nr:hypothetical protein [Deltaproteobacteria bacterium]
MLATETDKYLDAHINRIRGLKMGREEGLEMGLAEGEREKAMDIALKMLDADTPVD